MVILNYCFIDLDTIRVPSNILFILSNLTYIYISIFIFFFNGLFHFVSLFTSSSSLFAKKVSNNQKVKQQAKEKVVEKIKKKRDLKKHVVLMHFLFKVNVLKLLLRIQVRVLLLSLSLLYAQSFHLLLLIYVIYVTDLI